MSSDRTEDFDFHLPESLIAQEPARPREAARLLDATQPDMFADRHIRDLPSLLKRGDLLVANNTAVIRAQLHGLRGEAKIGITLDQIQPDGSWHVLVRNARRLKVGDTIAFPGVQDTARVQALEPGGGAVLQFSAEGDAFDAFLQKAGALALPPYIHRPEGPTAQDTSDYATIFERNKGAVAAPTAGLHFTPALLKAIDATGAQRCTLTLHVGAGTFLPVREAEISEHKMHSERGIITPETAERINATRKAGGRIIAIGTTSLRLLETATDENGIVHPFDGTTSIFIRPGYQFRAVDMLLTNFHLPRSTLFMLVSAFAGVERARQIYAHAVASGYRFYSYGDACLLRCAHSIHAHHLGTVE
ncbi:S-adenosylmethionine:tRNA ribosyltransferase-isomerase [Acetobacter pasteurianus]|uniref:S-adenosylmethionine:tRNA ribosyltransferase-isomerase n=2 Tax=Acetobacter pasteurianus TaxID=438 RepID=C7JBE5_ACEP3|nr:tRNA preQ1(34) S-adenosylmethionine ribosyltransferase-isomerase QueA [Acetobacter pasteurianus]BAU37283.1 S-adenosylmethionine:tRNA ribosyltransferase-isomerase [Acetobacter pasteurianus NBRC 101655]ASC05389.1 S-adenosylmethionine:tRNA ribosyltransferase-isomerase [Acetobacter pasteurianus subsp. pasteurianus]CCT59782.1 S-adenosylmethionine:tRNA ribosyltransferase-isomerase [Acetobacter pasteurianus 386B]BAH98372.1 tRNA ribosyltransferase/isomerase [Acetobacter pasteurianus IFO 3283-01]BAI